MSLLRRNKRAAVDERIAPMMTTESPLDRARFERLVETSLRLRDLGVDFETIQRRATADEVSWNAALEAIDRERSHG